MTEEKADEYRQWAVQCRAMARRVSARKKKRHGYSLHGGSLRSK
jgi:hypothetical protein